MMEMIQNVAILLSGVLFKLLYFVNELCQYIWWSITGVQSEVSKLSGHDGSKLKVQVLRPILRQYGSFYLGPMQDNVICWHEAFYPIEYILKPTVSFYMLHEKYAYFTEVTKGEDLYDSRKHPFLYYAQEKKADRFLRVHQDALVKFIETLNVSKRKVLWIFHSGRCGSTAIVQALNTLPGWTVISENTFVLPTLSGNWKTFENTRKYYTSLEFHNVVRAAIICQLYRIPESQNVCWKIIAGIPTGYLIPIIAKEFPNHKICFITRAGPKVANSILRGVGGHSIFELAIKGVNLVKGTTPMVLFRACSGVVNDSVKEFCLKNEISPYEFLYLLWLTSLYSLKENCSDVPLLYVDYEHFMTDLEKHLKELFDFAEIPMEHLNLALESFKRDSQENSPISREQLKNSTSWQRDEETVKKCTELAKSLGYPAFDDELRRKHLGLSKALFLSGFK